MTRPFFSALVLLMATAAHAARSPASDAILAELSRCDGAFFTALAGRSAEFAANPAFRVNGAAAYFQVPDRRDPKLSLIRFTSAPRLGSFEVVGYFDELFSFGPQAHMISWGFLLRAPVEQVVVATKSMIVDGDRLRRDDKVYVRSELWAHDSPAAGWQKVATVGGQIPAPGTIERVLLIEAFEDDPTLTRFGCSLQGSVTREMLRSHRPDIEFGAPTGP